MILGFGIVSQAEPVFEYQLKLEAKDLRRLAMFRYIALDPEYKKIFPQIQSLVAEQKRVEFLLIDHPLFAANNAHKAQSSMKKSLRDLDRKKLLLQRIKTERLSALADTILLLKDSLDRADDYLYVRTYSETSSVDEMHMTQYFESLLQMTVQYGNTIQRRQQVQKMTQYFVNKDLFPYANLVAGLDNNSYKRLRNYAQFANLDRSLDLRSRIWPIAIFKITKQPVLKSVPAVSPTKSAELIIKAILEPVAVAATKTNRAPAASDLGFTEGFLNPATGPASFYLLPIKNQISLRNLDINLDSTYEHLTQRIEEVRCDNLSSRVEMLVRGPQGVFKERIFHNKRYEPLYAEVVNEEDRKVVTLTMEQMFRLDSNTTGTVNDLLKERLSRQILYNWMQIIQHCGVESVPTKT